MLIFSSILVVIWPVVEHGKLRSKALLLMVKQLEFWNFQILFWRVVLAISENSENRIISSIPILENQRAKLRRFFWKHQT